MGKFFFYNKKIKFSLSQKSRTKNWILLVIKKEKSEVDFINFVFCSDSFLLSFNKKFLRHNTFTDIITFDYSEKKKISGDVFISIPRVKENAKIFNSVFSEELHRVMIHGVLHLLGYNDKSKKEKLFIREKENFYLKLF